MNDYGLSEPASPNAWTVIAPPHGVKEMGNEIDSLLPGGDSWADVIEGQFEPPDATSEKTMSESDVDPGATVTAAAGGPPSCSDSDTVAPAPAPAAPDGPRNL